MNMVEKNIFDTDNLELLRLISKEPNISQRKLSKELGFSLGKLNYRMKAMREKGFIKIQKSKDQKKKK